jgi:iron(III) transport system permease protein
MTRRPSLLSLFLSGAVLLFLLAPAVELHFRALWEVVLHPGLWGHVSPFSPTSLSLLWRSLALCAGVFLGTLVLGVPVGFGLARGPRWWRVLAGPLCAIAIAIPPALAAAPFVHLAVSAGMPEDGSPGTYFRSVLVLSGCYFPLVAGATMIGIRTVPPEEEEAALLLSGEVRAWLGVLRARILPAALGGAFGAAALALWEMGAPDLLGWPTFSMHVYRNLAATDASTQGVYQLSAPLTAAITGLPVLVIGFLLLLPAVQLMRSVELRAMGTSSIFEPTVSRLASWFCVPATVILLVFPLMLLVRFAQKVGTAHENGQVIRANSEAIINTLTLPGIGALGMTVGAFVLAVMWREWPATWRRAALLLALCPILVTPVVLGVALMDLWNQPVFGAIYDSPYGMTLIGYLGRFAPLMIALALWSVQSVDEELLRAARGLGASWGRVARTVTAPILRVSLVGLCALAFSLCAGELTVTVQVQSAGGETLPIQIFSLLHAGLSGDVAMLSLVQCALSGGAMVLATFFLGRRR